MEVGDNSNLGIPNWLIDGGCGLRSERRLGLTLKRSSCPVPKVDPLCVCRQSWFHFSEGLFSWWFQSELSIYALCVCQKA